MNGIEIANAIEKLIDAKTDRQAKIAADNWKDLDQAMHSNFVANAKAEIANLFP